MSKRKRKQQSRRFRYWWLVLVGIILVLLIAAFPPLPITPMTQGQGQIDYAYVLNMYSWDYADNQFHRSIPFILMANLIAFGTIPLMIGQRWQHLEVHEVLGRVLAFYGGFCLLTFIYGITLSGLLGVSSDISQRPVFVHLTSLRAMTYTYHLTQYSLVPEPTTYAIFLFRCENDRDDCTVIETPYQNQPEASTHGVPFADLMLWHDQTPGYLNIVGGGVVLYSWKLDDLNAEMDALEE